MKEITYEKMREKIDREIEKMYCKRRGIWNKESALKHELEVLTKEEQRLDIAINALEDSKEIILDITFNE